MEKTIYLASYGEFNDVKLIELICNYFTKNINHENVRFIAPLGGKNGDIVCRNYVIKNKFKHLFFKPSKMDKPDVLEQCDHAILFNNGMSKGINIHLKTLPKFIKGKIVEVHTNNNSLSIYQFNKEFITKKYCIENDNFILSK